MTKAGIRQIESMLQVSLPKGYIELMTSADAEQANDDWYRYLFNNSTVIFTQTILLREIAASSGMALKHSYVVVTEVDGGDSVMIDCAKDDGSLFKWNHETNEVEPFGTLAQFAKDF